MISLMRGLMGKLPSQGIYYLPLLRTSSPFLANEDVRSSRMPVRIFGEFYNVV